MKRRKLWRLIVTVSDTPIGDEDYMSEEDIKKLINEVDCAAGLEVNVAEIRDMGTP